MRFAQRGFIEKLLEEREVPAGFRAQNLLDRFYANNLNNRKASDLIDALRSLPREYRGGHAAGRIVDLPDVLPGRYCIYGRNSRADFYRVMHGKNQYTGWLYLAVQASEDFYPITGIARARVVLGLIHSNPQEAAQRYGRLLGKCFSCGRILTNDVSRSIGCGPVCAKKYTWFDLKTIRALERAGE